MENLGQRMTYLLMVKGLNPNKLGILTGIHPSTIKNYINNIGKPDETKLDKISSVLDISSAWLKSGNGEMENNKIENPTQEAGFLQSYYEKLLAQKDQFLDSVLKDNERMREELDLIRSRNNKK